MSKTNYDYYSTVTSVNSDNPCQMWNSVNKILHREKTKLPPDCISEHILCRQFPKYSSSEPGTSLRLTRFIRVRRSHGSLHISFTIRLSVHLHRPTTILLPFLVIISRQPCLPYTTVFASVPVALTACPNHLTFILLTFSRSVSYPPMYFASLHVYLHIRCTRGVMLLQQGYVATVFECHDGFLQSFVANP